MTSLAFTLRLNAASCFGFGALFVILPGKVAAVLGTIPPVVLVGLGAALLINGAHLALVSMRTQPRRAEILWFSLCDLAWWLVSVFMIAAGIWITTPVGVTLTLLVGICVAGLGTAQLFLLGLERSEQAASRHWQRIGRSWLSLPVWVKAWLFALNAVFLAAPFVLPWEAASVVLLGYAASGPLLLGFAVYGGGLSRAMGIGHLVPWTPLLVWLIAHPDMFAGDPLGFSFAVILSVMIAACLAFDLYDLLRWIRGERDILLMSIGTRKTAAQ